MCCTIFFWFDYNFNGQISLIGSKMYHFNVSFDKMKDMILYCIVSSKDQYISVAETRVHLNLFQCGQPKINIYLPRF